MYDFGLRLKELRKARGLTQKKLAERINKSVSAVSSYESNAQLPPLDVSKSIALALGISIDYLVGNEEIPAYSTEGFTKDQTELMDALICVVNRCDPQSRKYSHAVLIEVVQ